MTTIQTLIPDHLTWDEAHDVIEAMSHVLENFEYSAMPQMSLQIASAKEEVLFPLSDTIFDSVHANNADRARLIQQAVHQLELNLEQIGGSALRSKFARDFSEMMSEPELVAA